jgi:hypothetical protein
MLTDLLYRHCKVCCASMQHGKISQIINSNTKANSVQATAVVRHASNQLPRPEVNYPSRPESCRSPTYRAGRRRLFGKSTAYPLF